MLTIYVNMHRGRLPRPVTRGVSSVPEFGYDTSSQRLISSLIV